MPANEDFMFNVFVNGNALPEYHHNGCCYVESSLATPASYRKKRHEVINGEVEDQEWPVTPYEIEITSRASVDMPSRYFRISVDGVKVKGAGLAGGMSKIIRGFKDKTCVKEFLFSLPRFATSERDRIDSRRLSDIGSIKVECWEGKIKSIKRRGRVANNSFTSANKKDSTRVTLGKYTMTTTDVGRAVEELYQFRRTDHWVRTKLRSTLQVRYHMRHTLQEIGISLPPLDNKIANVSSQPGVSKTAIPISSPIKFPDAVVTVDDDDNQEQSKLYNSEQKMDMAVVKNHSLVESKQLIDTIDLSSVTQAMDTPLENNQTQMENSITNEHIESENKADLNLESTVDSSIPESSVVTSDPVQSLSQDIDTLPSQDIVCTSNHYENIKLKPEPKEWSGTLIEID